MMDKKCEFCKKKIDKSKDVCEGCINKVIAGDKNND